MPLEGPQDRRDAELSLSRWKRKREGSTNMKRCIRVLTFVFLLVAITGCATPGETRADYILQGSIQSVINANEIAQRHPFGGRVVDTKVLSEDAGTITEAWHVKRGARTVTYTVKFTPSPKGGTVFEVTMPEEDRK